MSHEEIVKESDTLRVKLVLDESPHEPYDDGGSPIVRIEYGRHGRYSATQIKEVTSYVLPLVVEEAIEEFLEEHGLDLHSPDFLAALAPFGVTKIDTYDPREGGTYLTLDPADWREKVGAAEGSISLEEWQAYCEGDVWGYVIEELQLWRNEATGSKRETWEEVDSCWGFYGDYARTAATEEYDAELARREGDQ